MSISFSVNVEGNWWFLFPAQFTKASIWGPTSMKPGTSQRRTPFLIVGQLFLFPSLMQILVWNAQKCPCGKPIDLKGWELCHSWLKEHDMEEEDTWTDYDIPSSRMFYRPYHLPATLAEVRPHMNADHRDKHGLLSTADYIKRLAEYRNLASNVIF